MSERNLLPLPTPQEARQYLNTYDRYIIDEVALYIAFRRIAKRIENRRVFEEHISKGKWMKIMYQPITVHPNDFTGPKPLRIGLQEVRYHLIDDRTLVKPQLLVEPAVHDPREADERPPIARKVLKVDTGDWPTGFAYPDDIFNADITNLRAEQAIYTEWLNIAMGAQNQEI